MFDHAPQTSWVALLLVGVKTNNLSFYYYTQKIHNFAMFNVYDMHANVKKDLAKSWASNFFFRCFPFFFRFFLSLAGELSVFFQHCRNSSKDILPCNCFWNFLNRHTFLSFLFRVVTLRACDWKFYHFILYRLLYMYVQVFDFIFQSFTYLGKVANLNNS